MRLIVLCGLVALALAGSSRLQQWREDAEPFRSGKQYRFRYESQISTGLGNVEQVSSHRISAIANVNFETERVATLQLQNIRVGALNQPIEEPRKLQPARLFDEKEIDSEFLQQLEQPIKFDYVDGLVERVFFHQKESSWSKNIKRAVLNMLQLNLKRRESNLQEYGWEQLRNNEDDKTTQSRMFTLPENTLEGECQTVYTINKVNEETSQEQQLFNVTKSIDFQRCKKLASIRYGPRIEKPTFESEQREIESNELDRSTVFRFQLSGNQDKYAIGRVELLSQYVYKNLNAEQEQPLQTVVVAELALESVEAQEKKNVVVSQKEESLTYSSEWEKSEKRFFQYGDEEFSRESSPFSKVQNKVQIAKSLIKRIAQDSHDKTNGISNESPLKLQQLVEIVRMCSTQELKQIYEQITESKTEQTIFVDTLAIAGTRNTIHFIVEATLKQEITPSKTVQALQQLSGIPVVSSKHVEQIFRLCKSEVAQRSGPLRQACWLTAGSLIGDLCKESIYETAEESEKQCPRDIKEKFQKTLINEYKKAETTYEKVLALKAIGNAAIDLTIFDLEKIIIEPRESPVVRQQAIDALRRLRNQMPRKIQRILLPVFKNTQEQPEVRMTAFSMIMHTIPDKAILDQITYVLFNERSQHVKSFVYTTMKALSQSPIQVEQELARHLETSLKIAKVEEQQLRGSRFYRVPIYSQEQQEGLFFNWASLFSTNNMLPKHLSLSMDSFLNGLLEKNSFEISLTQTDIENYYQQIFNEVYGSLESSSQKALRGNRRSESRGEFGRELLDNVFESLKIQPRRRYSENQTPYGMLCLRIRDIDQIVLPLSDETMPEIVRSLINGEKPSISTISKLLEGQRFRVNTVSSLHERSLKIATTSGLPLKIQHSLPVVASVEGELKVKIQSEGLKAEIKIQPMISGVHSQKIELWCPMINTGVESLRSVELNLPIESEVVVAYNSEKTEKVRINLRLPEQRTRLVTLTSLPITFTREFDSQNKMHREPKIKTIRNPQMESRYVELIPEERQTISVRGHFHKPTEVSYEQILSLATVTENRIVVEFEPLSESPKEVELTLYGKLFQSTSQKTHQPRFESFYSSKKFERLHEEDMEDASLESENEREQKLNKYVSKYEANKVYEHSVKAQIKTIGGRQQHQASLELTAVCDNQLTFCKVNTDISRTPLFRHENREWTLSAKTQILTPRSVRNVEQLRENEQDKLVFTIEAEWGSEKTQNLNLKLEGERAVPEQWTRREWRKQLLSAFVNKYDIVADYKLNEFSRQLFFRGFELFKLYNYWNVERSQEVQGQQGHVFASFTIDPRTRQHFNLTVKTPSEVTKFSNIELPFSLKPWTLVRPQNTRQIESVDDVLEQFSESVRAECRVDGQRIKTFDQVIYKAPIHQCYSIIAKDCSERKSFVVMMKRLEENSQDKKIKIVTRNNVIEVEPKNDKLSVKVNGERVERQQLDEYDVEYSEERVIVNLPQGVSVHFDGEEATVKMSQLYKNSQCGLCGHYDEESEDEFRMNDDSETEDLKQFHKSFSMLEDSECERRSAEKIYEQDSLFQRESSRRRQDDSDYESNFESDEDAEEYEQFEHSRRHGQEEESEEALEKKTLIIEYNHKICFSMKAVKQCPEGTYYQKAEQSKAQFTCLNRSSETRRLVNEAREGDITNKLSGFKPSFVDTVRVHTTCSQY